MNDLTNWESRLRQIAAEHPDASGKAGEILRSRLRQQEAHELKQDVSLAHARAREAVVTGTRMALRCGALLLKAQPEELPGLLGAAGIQPQAAQSYLSLAQQAAYELRQRSLHRRGKITEQEALHALRGSLTPDPVADLRALNNQEFQP